LAHSEEAVLQARQPKILAQRPPSIFVPQQPVPLQLRHHAIDGSRRVR
jgi:hypothetical protein